MSPEQIGKLFQAFTQADASTTPSDSAGPALVSRITKHFCDMLGGDISVDSEPGKGSTSPSCCPIARSRRSARPREPRRVAPAPSGARDRARGR